MHKRIILYLTALCVLLITAAHAQESRQVARIGYFEAGPYFMHKLMYRSISDALETMRGDSVEIIFEPYAYKSAGWERDKCRAMAREFDRMAKIDVVLAAGPWVIEDLIDAGYEGAIVGVYQFDPQVQGLTTPQGIPVVTNLTVNIVPDKISSDIARMVQLFECRRIGFLYFPSGDEFDVMTDKVKGEVKDLDIDIYSAIEYSDWGLFSFFKSFAELRHKIDALYLPPLWGMELDQINQFLLEVARARIPAFTAEGFPIMEKGATAGNIITAYRAEGRFIAGKILSIINGAIPSKLPTTFSQSQALCLNLESAHKLNIDFNQNYLLNARTIPALPEESVPRYTYARAVEQAVRESSGLLYSREIFNGALKEAGRAWGEYLPRIDLSVAAAAADNTAEAAAYNKLFNREFAAEINFEQKLFSFSALKNVKIARKNKDITEIDVEQARLDLQAAVTEAYIDILDIEDRMTENEELVNRYREFFEIALIDQQMKLKDTFDISLLEEKLISHKIESHKLQSELKIARIIFNILLNRPGDEDVILDRQEFSTENMVFLARKFDSYIKTSGDRKKLEEFFVNEGIKASSEIRIADLSLGIQRELLSRHKYRYLPEISLHAGYSYASEFDPGIDDRNDNWLVGGRLTVPVFSGKETLFDRAVLNSRLDALSYKKDTIRFSKYREIVMASERFVSTAATLPMHYFTKNLSTQNAELAFDRYKRNQMPVMNLISLAENSHNNDTELAAARRQFFLLYADLLHSLGMEYLEHGTGRQKEFYDRLEGFLAGKSGN